jgi:hypothetical protein
MALNIKDMLGFVSAYIFFTFFLYLTTKLINKFNFSFLQVGVFTLIITILGLTIEWQLK